MKNCKDSKKHFENQASMVSRIYNGKSATPQNEKTECESIRNYIYFTTEKRPSY